MANIKRPPPSPLSDEERALFLRAVEGAIPVSSVVRSPAVTPIAESDEDVSFIEAMSKMRTVEIAMAMREKRLENKPGVPPKKKRSSSFDATIDLHGMVREHARRRLEMFIGRCIALHKRHLLVIHGKGSGALRDEVWALLQRDGRVAIVNVAAQQHGGEGAVEVMLKTRVMKKQR